MTSGQSAALAIAAVVVAVIALVGAGLALRTLGRLRRAAGLLGRGGFRGESFLEATGRQARTTAELRREVGGWHTVLAAERAQLDESVQRLSEHTGHALRRVAVVHYDAFPDLAGRLSFSLALLDSAGTGVVLSSIAGRAETRLYAKPVTAGTADVDLSPEERQAIKAALSG